MIAVVLAAGAVSVYLYNQPLRSSRPADGAEISFLPTNGETVDARLWQDPLQVIRSDWDRLVAETEKRRKLPTPLPVPHTVVQMRKMIKRLPELQEEEDGKLLIIGAFIRGQPYANHAESRRRSRYALVSALSDENYFPREPYKIGYFVSRPFFRSPSRNGQLQERDLVRVGFEWFTNGLRGNSEDPNEKRWDKVLVLWMNSDDFGDYPLHHFYSLVEYFISRPLAENEEKIRAAVVGPADSTMLEGMLEAVSDLDQDSVDPAEFKKHLEGFESDLHPSLKKLLRLNTKLDEQSNKKCVDGRVSSLESDGRSAVSKLPTESSAELPLHVFSPYSTVPLSMLLKKTAKRFPEDPEVWDEKIRRKLRVSSFRSMLARDDAVLITLARELVSRGLEANCEQASSVAIVSELDSPYGRAMMKIFQNALDIEKCSEDKKPKFFPYLPGVDGETPPSTKEGSSFRGGSEDEPTDVFRSVSLVSAPREPAVGPVQLDYVRRLADYIVRIARDAETPIQAIGVFATDFYDKQLILQALRERLPNVRFFTTDLDARLTAPDEYLSNRNLIVGSAYGLSPSENEFNVAPFRDSYQTAVFKAVQLALESDCSKASICFRPPDPRVFEIGRSSAVDITVLDPQQPCCDCEEGQRTTDFGWLAYAGIDDSRWPTGIDDPRLPSVFLLLTPLIALMLACWFKNRRLSKKHEKHVWRANRVACALSAIASVMIGIVMLFWSDPAWEPLLLYEGISAMPMPALHLTVIVYAIAFILIGRGRLLQLKESAKPKFKAQPKDGQDEFVTKEKTPFGFVQSISITTWEREVGEAKEQESALEISDIWHKYILLGGMYRRAFRAVPWALLWTIVMIYSFRSSASPLLAREIGDQIEWVRAIAVFFSLTAIFLCTDALRLGRAYMDALTLENISGWKGRNEDPDIRIEDKHVRDHWRKMRAIVAHTEYISPLIVLPFFLIFLLLLARSTFFEAWPWPLLLIAAYAGFSAYLLACAYLYQRSASRSREEILDALGSYKQELTKKKRRPALMTTDIVMAKIRSYNKGAFVPWTRHPILQSILVPSIGFSLLLLLEYLNF